MSYIVKQKVKGNEYYYLRKSVRDGKKVKSKNIAYLGKNRSEAEKKAEKIKMEEEKSQRKLEKQKISIEELTKFCKKKGFVYRSSDIYGGFAGFWDYGPLGAELFENIKKEWKKYFVQAREDILGINSSIISHPRVWKASGHIDNFNDIFVKCKKCGKTNKVEEEELGKVKCPFCGGDFESQGKFNLMFQTNVGVGEATTKAYLRGETAQGIFRNFKLITQTNRLKLPFGIAQIGKCFRNEIAPRDFLFRSREFNIAELEFFIHPKEKKCNLLTKEHLELEFDFLDSETQNKGEEKIKKTSIKELLEKNKLGEWHAYWLAEQIIWFRKFDLNNFKIREHTKDELSHYSSSTFDIDYQYPFGSKEVAGNANRGQFDLSQHQKESKEKMEIFDEETKQKVIPRVIEPTFGVERIFLAVLSEAYYRDEKENIVLNINKKLSPIKVAIFPLVKKPEFEKIAKEIYNTLKKELNVVYDKSGSIGRRYARQDEIGTPFCITVDGDSLENKDVTIRERNTGKQTRVKLKKIKEILLESINK